MPTGFDTTAPSPVPSTVTVRVGVRPSKVAVTVRAASMVTVQVAAVPHAATDQPDQVEPVAGRVPPPEEAVMRLRIGDKLIVLNPVVYARRVEFGFVGEDSRGRYFSQAGRGMVQQTVVEVPAIAERATLRIIEGGSGS